LRPSGRAGAVVPSAPPRVVLFYAGTAATAVLRQMQSNKQYSSTAQTDSLLHVDDVVLFIWAIARVRSL